MGGMGDQSSRTFLSPVYTPGTQMACWFVPPQSGCFLLCEASAEASQEPAPRPPGPLSVPTGPSAVAGDSDGDGNNAVGTRLGGKELERTTRPSLEYPEGDPLDETK